MYLVGGSTLQPFQVKHFLSILIMQVIQFISESCLQITKSLPGAGEVLTALSLMTDTPPVDNWFVSSSLLSIKSLKQLAYVNATSFQFLVHFAILSKESMRHGIKLNKCYGMFNCRDMVAM